MHFSIALYLFTIKSIWLEYYLWILVISLTESLLQVDKISRLQDISTFCNKKSNTTTLSITKSFRLAHQKPLTSCAAENDF